ncbi:MAG: alpha-2-macroglobulin family protein [Bacteroidales bacterium]|jgi:uncharacterized protein YfaS (alpha-2-macroglobulin family)|nr:alpha-2-macroglobulin family protein [Bacteroidales bacterium]
MKTNFLTISFLLGMITFIVHPLIAEGAAFPFDYKKEWENVHLLENQGKPRSAMELVDRIYKQAKTEKNQPQMLKALEYGIRLSSRFEEAYFEKGITRINEEMPQFSEPSVQVLHSLLADLYLGYYSKNRYLVLQRTTVADYELNDMATWDQKLFAEKIFGEYVKSLENPEVLQSTPASEYADILTNGDSLNLLRPTLYDILAHHALNFYKNDEMMSHRPAIRFEIDDPQMLDIASSFVKLALEKKEDFSMKFHALKLYQELIAFHLEDVNPVALIDLDLNRLEFVSEHAIFENKESILLHTLQQMESIYIGNECVTEIYYHIARHYNSEGNKYQPLVSDDHQRDKLIAVEYCENAINEFPDSYGAKHCKILLDQIREKFINTQLEYANLPGEYFLSSLQFKNIAEVFIRVIQLDPAENRNRNYTDQDNKLAAYREIRPVKQWSVNLPVDIDHNSHRTEIAIPPLTEGYYALMISSDPSFDKNKGVISINDFWVSNISYISKEKENGDLQFYVLDRKTGHHLPGVKVVAYEEFHNRAMRETQLRETGQYTSDDDGAFVIPAYNTGPGRLILEFTREADRFTSPGYFYISKPHDPDERTVRQTYFFTDRSIYRPGQTIYFKGIMVERLGEKHEIVINEKTPVRFYDVNGQLVAEHELQTNEYGSFNGSFTAPIGMLTGKMRIQNETGSVYFSVEEYKRPKFEVVFDPVKGSYKLGSDITVSGKAQAYAGNPVDHATVKYRVVRNAYFPYRYYWAGFYPQSSEAEIAFGVAETASDGSFDIRFTAIPDPSSHAWGTPVFTYTVTVDVTDMSGETHTAVNTVSVSEKSLLINLELAEEVNREKLKDITLETTNLNGEKEAAEVDVKIMRLKVPDHVLQERSWTRPDVYLIAEDDFKQWFPLLPYRNEDDRNNWKETSLVYDATLNTETDSVLNIEDLKSWETGVYKIAMTAEDIFGEEVNVIRFFSLYSEKDKNLPDKRAEQFIALDNNVEPGEYARFLVGTAFTNVRMLYTLTAKEGVREQKWIDINENQMLLEFPVMEKDRGGMQVSFVFVSHNKSYSYSSNILVPYTNKELDISFESFRNKLLPGEEEKWSIKIRNNKGEKVAAEMLAGLYDASLDAFVSHSWQFSLYHSRYFHSTWDAANAFTQNSGQTYRKTRAYDPNNIPTPRIYQRFDWADLYAYGWGYGSIKIKDARGSREAIPMAGEMSVLDEATIAEESKSSEQQNGRDKDGGIAPPAPTDKSDLDNIPVRKNLQETAFFFPDLRTNENGDVIFSFTIPEALTRWKFMGLAHTQDLSYGMITRELVTQKDLMIVPNQPRFFREGDEIYFSAKVVNLSEDELKGTATLQLLDATSMKPLDKEFGNLEQEVSFEISEGNSGYVSWKLEIPENSAPVMYRVIASADDFSDGEEMVIPVLKNRMLVTESLPLPIRGNETKHFTFESLAVNKSSTLRDYSYTLEFTSNPAWYAVQALPYLMEYPYECSEQIFNRVYSNALASSIVNQHPNIKTVFQSWVGESPDALLSNLEKNQDLKNALLEETPWVMQAKNESERKKRLALLFDLNRMERELSTALNRLQQKQLGSGAWPWFAGGRENRYITQYIISGMGKMVSLGILDMNDHRVKQMVSAGLRYLDEQMFEDFTRIRQKHENYLNERHISRTHIQYLYARSFFLGDYYFLEKHKEAYKYFKEQARKYWTDEDKFLQGMIALAMHRMGEHEISLAVMASIKEHALYDDEMGMYWRDRAGYYWYEAPIETQALLIEAFDEIINDRESVELMKTWLLKQKQTQDWETTRATADACYALLMRGANLIAVEGDVAITVGGELIDPDKIDGVEREAGTGYFRHDWSGSDITPDMANITVSKDNDGVAWGAVYWQYFEDLDKITAQASPLSIQKKLFLRTYTDEGPVLTPVNDGDILKPGDKLISRIEIRSDRDMEFVHMKDMRAAALEPENNLSGYHWQGGLGYYESIRDASVNFFFSYLRKGTYVFEYPLNVTQRGTFSNGISTIQCMYAPEFSSHSEGVRIVVD